MGQTDANESKPGTARRMKAAGFKQPSVVISVVSAIIACIALGHSIWSFRTLHTRPASIQITLPDQAAIRFYDNQSFDLSFYAVLYNSGSPNRVITTRNFKLLATIERYGQPDKTIDFGWGGTKELVSSLEYPVRYGRDLTKEERRYREQLVYKTKNAVFVIKGEESLAELLGFWPTGNSLENILAPFKIHVVLKVYAITGGKERSFQSEEHVYSVLKRDQTESLDNNINRWIYVAKK